VEPTEVVLRFLESVGRRSDAEFYLKLFRGEAKEAFAALYVDANVARHATEAVVLDLRFLAGLGLAPVTVLGVLEPTDAPEHAARIVRRLGREGVTAVILTSSPRLLEETAAAARAGTLPIVVYRAEDGATLEDRFARLGQLLAALHTRKLIFLHRPGGLRVSGALIPIVNLTDDYANLIASRELSHKQRIFVAQARRLVFDLVGHRLVVSITSPLDLLRELFTVKGAGTLLRRGAVLLRKNSLAEIDRERLSALLASAFGQPPVEAFFTRPVSRIYLEEGYRGAAILQSTPLGAYLSKFAVDREAQGEGMGRDLWDLVLEDNPTVFWRARSTNRICAWYDKVADGLARFPGWHVYWKGLDPELIPAAISHALAAPVDIPPTTDVPGD
jgi:hypothetical protein